MASAPEIGSVRLIWKVQNEPYRYGSRSHSAYTGSERYELSYGRYTDRDMIFLKVELSGRLKVWLAEHQDQLERIGLSEADRNVLVVMDPGIDGDVLAQLTGVRERALTEYEHAEAYLQIPLNFTLDHCHEVPLRLQFRVADAQGAPLSVNIDI